MIRAMYYFCFDLYYVITNIIKSTMLHYAQYHVYTARIVICIMYQPARAMYEHNLYYV